MFQFVFSAKRTRPKAPSKIHQELDQLKVEREQPQKRLEEVDAMIQLKESNLAQLPQAINEKKKEREKIHGPSFNLARGAIYVPRSTSKMLFLGP